MQQVLLLRLFRRLVLLLLALLPILVLPILVLLLRLLPPSPLVLLRCCWRCGGQSCRRTWASAGGRLGTHGSAMARGAGGETSSAH